MSQSPVSYYSPCGINCGKVFPQNLPTWCHLDLLKSILVNDGIEEKWDTRVSPNALP